MFESEPVVLWPDHQDPPVVTRSLSVRNRQTKTVLTVHAIELIVLVNGCVYLVPADANGFYAGDVLVLDVEWMRRHKKDRLTCADHVFNRFDGISEARCAVGRVHDGYKPVSIPELVHGRFDANWLLHTSWNLARAQTYEDHAFVWCSQRPIRERISDKAVDQMERLARFLKLSSISGAFAGKHVTTIPLPCEESDRLIVSRTQEVRGIGRSLDWRAIALEFYADQLRATCRNVGRSIQKMLTADDLFRPSRSAKTYQVYAKQLADHADKLAQLKFHRLSRILPYASGELFQAVKLIHQAAEYEARETEKSVRTILGRVFRTLIFFEEHLRLQELMIIVADHVEHQFVLCADQIRLLIEELSHCHRRLTSLDPITQEHIDKGFGTNVLSVVTGNTLLARTNLSQRSGVNLAQLYGELKTACSSL